MEIEWEETAVWSVAETVRYSAAEGAGNGLGQERIVEEGPRKLRMEFCSALRRRETEHAERREGFGWREAFHAAEVSNGGERSWISAAVSFSTTTIGPPHLGQRQRPFE
jgi:hypothetical protein